MMRNWNDKPISLSAGCIIDGLPKTPTAKVEKHVMRTEGVTGDTWDRERAGISIGREKF